METKHEAPAASGEGSRTTEAGGRTPAERTVQMDTAQKQTRQTARSRPPVRRVEAESDAERLASLAAGWRRWFELMERIRREREGEAIIRLEAA